MSHALTVGETPTSDDKLWAAIAHLTAYLFLPGVGALLAYLIFKDKAPFVKYHAVQSMVVQLAIYILSGITCGFGLILFLLPLYGAWKAYQGEWSGYPLLEGFGK
jgi:uncharacterized membrane protein